MPNIEYKTKRIEDEFSRELFDRNRALYDLVNAAAVYTGYEFSKPLILTSVFRTPEEQGALYSHLPENQRPHSPHQDWKAVDLRSWAYTDDEINRLLRFLNTFTVMGGQRQVALYHEIPGNVKHFHIQYWR